MDVIRILYVTKLKNTMANGVTAAVTQLMNSICIYAVVGWLDVGNVDIDVDNRIERYDLSNWESFNADIAVFEDPFNTLFFCKISKQLRKRKIPYIIAPHGCFNKIALRNHYLKKIIAINTVFRCYLNGCIATQFLCDGEKDKSISFSDSIIIPNGIMMNDNCRVVKNVKKMVFIGRKNVKNKGIDDLLMAVNLKKRVLESQGIKIGIYGSIESQNDEDFINSYIYNNSLQNIVTNNGPVFGADKEKILNDADVFISTSRHEGFPMSILEGLSYGLPVLVTRGTNMYDMVKNAKAGWVCDNSVEDIALTLDKVSSEKDVECLSGNARNLSLKYSWEKISEDTIKMYGELIRNYRKV